jgi:hypothetical protein
MQVQVCRQSHLLQAPPGHGNRSWSVIDTEDAKPALSQIRHVATRPTTRIQNGLRLPLFEHLDEMRHILVWFRKEQPRLLKDGFPDRRFVWHSCCQSSSRQR